MNRSGVASADAREDAGIRPIAEPQPSGTRARTVSSPRTAQSKRRGRRRSRSDEANRVRYFVGRPSEPDGKPTLEQEVASEPEGLVIAFKNDSRVYFVSEYRVTQRIEGGEVRLEKEPAATTQRVSTTNAS